MNKLWCICGANVGRRSHERGLVFDFWIVGCFYDEEQAQEILGELKAAANEVNNDIYFYDEISDRTRGMIKQLDSRVNLPELVGDSHNVEYSIIESELMVPR